VHPSSYSSAAEDVSKHEPYERSFSFTGKYRRSSMRMLVTTSDGTPTHLCLQAGKESFPGFVGLVFERMIQVASTGV
jgi:hypothetical protein